MSMLKIFDVSGSAMSAQSVRLNLVASNMANADSVAPSAELAYRSRHPVFATVLSERHGQAAGGVQVRGVLESSEPVHMRYDPGNPLANREGYVFASNVDVVSEMADLISASRAYQANVEVLGTARELMLQTLNLGR